MKAIHVYQVRKDGKVCTSFLYEIMYEFFVRDYVRENKCRNNQYKVEKYVLLENSNTGENDNDTKIYKWYLNQCRE